MLKNITRRQTGTPLPAQAHGAASAPRRALARSKKLPLLSADPEQISLYLMAHLGWRRREIFVVLFLDAQSRLIGASDLFRGGRYTCKTNIAEIVRAAYRNEAHEIIVAHNHPMGGATPSDPDVRLTRRLRLALFVAGVPLRDHIIVAHGEKAYSMADKGPWHAPLEEYAALIRWDFKAAP